MTSGCVANISIQRLEIIQGQGQLTLSILINSTQSATFRPTPISFTSSSRARSVSAFLSPDRNAKTPSSEPWALRSIAAVFWIKSARYPKPKDRSLATTSGDESDDGVGKEWWAAEVKVGVCAPQTTRGGAKCKHRFSTILVIRDMLLLDEQMKLKQVNQAMTDRQRRQTHEMRHSQGSCRRILIPVKRFWNPSNTGSRAAQSSYRLFKSTLS